MRKRVIYNGSTLSFLDCTNPAVLEKGKIYEVDSESVTPLQTNYALRGIDGQFHSVWFKEIPDFPKTFLAIGKEVPYPGEECFLSRLQGFDRIPQWCYRRTSIVKSVEPIGDNTFRVVTQNSIYILKIV